MFTDRQIRSASNRSTSVRELLNAVGYTANHPGTNTISRFSRLIGDGMYREIASGVRKNTPKSQWMTVRVNSRKAVIAKRGKRA